MNGKRQKMQQLELPFIWEGRGEAPKPHRRVEPLMASIETESPTEATANLMEEIASYENLKKAMKRVKANGGSPGIDGMDVELLPEYFETHWQEIGQQLLEGSYHPQAVLRVEIPKAGGGVRKLGIPTVIDRLVQQAVGQVLQKHYDPEFSEFSFGFRPKRSAHQAVEKAQTYLENGFRWVVDIDLEKFFDRVNHDRLMGQIARKIKDKRLLRLIRAFLSAGVMENGLVSPVTEGTPQGGPLSPLLSNIVLDELDKELERRGHRFVRYADDCNIYVRSKRAGLRVMESLRDFIEKRLKLKVNTSKSAVDRPWRRKFLGFTFIIYKGKVKRRIAPASLKRMKERIRELTRRKRTIGLDATVAELNQYLRGWRGYFGFCQTPSVLEHLDSWIKRRIRCLIWKQWKNGKRRYQELRKRGVSKDWAAMGAVGNHRHWRMSRTPAMNLAFNNAFFKEIGLVSLAESAV